MKKKNRNKNQQQYPKTKQHNPTSIYNTQK